MINLNSNTTKACRMSRELNHSSDNRLSRITAIEYSILNEREHLTDLAAHIIEMQPVYEAEIHAIYNPIGSITL